MTEQEVNSLQDWGGVGLQETHSPVHGGFAGDNRGTAGSKWFKEQLPGAVLLCLLSTIERDLDALASDGLWRLE